MECTAIVEGVLKWGSTKHEKGKATETYLLFNIAQVGYLLLKQKEAAARQVFNIAQRAIYRAERKARSAL